MNLAERPGSFLNGPDGRPLDRTPTKGPPSAETAYHSHEYYNHDKVRNGIKNELADNGYAVLRPGTSTRVVFFGQFFFV